MHIYSKQLFQMVNVFNEGCKIQKVDISEMINSKHLIVSVAKTPE